MYIHKIHDHLQRIVDPRCILDLHIDIDEALETINAEFIGSGSSKPQISFATLVDISETFGTKLIDLSDGRRVEGCESCNYGAEVGVIITIRQPTKNFNY